MPVALIVDDETLDCKKMATAPLISNVAAEGNKPSSTSLVEYGNQGGASKFSLVPSTYTTDDDSEFEDDVVWSDSDAEFDEDEDDMEDAMMEAEPPVPAKTGIHSTTVMAASAQQTSLLPKAVAILSSESVDIEHILAVMRALPMEPQVQCLACEKLWVASWDDAERLVDFCGVQLLLEAMSRFPRFERLQQCACETLQNVAALEEDECPSLQGLPQAEICQRGGVGLIVQAMLNHPHDHNLQLCGCTTLTSLAADLPDNHTIMQEEGAIDALVQALRCYGGRHRAVEMGARQALEALGYMYQDSEEHDEDIA